MAKGEDRRTKDESSSSEWLSWNRKSLVREYRSGKDAVPRGAGKEGEVESRSLRGKFEIQKRREQNDENDLPALLSRLERSLVSRAVHLRSTNLSIVSRQISGNITDMFRHEPSSSLSVPPPVSDKMFRCFVAFDCRRLVVPVATTVA